MKATKAARVFGALHPVPAGCQASPGGLYSAPGITRRPPVGPSRLRRETGIVTDRELLTRYVAEKAEDAFAEIVSRHVDRVYGTCLRVLGNAHDAEDAAQAAFLVLSRKARRLAPDVSLEWWLYWAARNCAMDLKRREARRARREEEAEMLKTKDNRQTEGAVWEQLRPQLDSLLAALPRKEQEAVVLYYFYGRTQEEIGRQRGCSHRTVGKRLSSALEKLRRKMSAMGVGVPAATLGGLLAKRAVSQAPTALVGHIQTVCAGRAAASQAALSTVEGTMKAMMWMKVKLAGAVLLGAAVVGGGGIVAARKLVAGESGKVLPAAAATSGKVILDTDSFWRFHSTIGTDVVRNDDGKLIPVHPDRAYTGRYAGMYGRKLKNPAILAHPHARVWALPKTGWQKPNFDDSAWARLKGPFVTDKSRKPIGYFSVPMTCLRGRFQVTNPSGGLQLSVAYRGGVVVYVNGKEVARRHLPAGKLTPGAAAEPYPKEAFVDPKGKLIPWKNRKSDPALAGQYAKRIRHLEGLAIPASALKKGINVLALEVHRAPALPVMYLGKGKSDNRPWWDWWSRVGVDSIRLTGAAAVAHTGRPKGFQVWAKPVYEEVEAIDYLDPSEPTGQVRLCTGRGGVCSGQVIAGSDAPFKGLKAVVSDLKGPASLPASTVQLRYARMGWKRKRRPLVFSDLEDFPQESGKVQPIWLTVRVPANAKPGSYSGKVTVSAAGQKSVDVPITLRVVDWKVPGPDKYDNSFLEFIQSPESVAMHYKVEMWSAKHWKLLDRTFKLLGEMGNKMVHLTAQRQTHFGNDHAMIRFKKGNGGKYIPDFSIADKYLGLVAKYMKGTRIVSLYTWRCPWGDSNFVPGVGSKGGKDLPVLISVIGPGGKLEKVEGPKWGTPECVALWKPVFDGVKGLLKKHGIREDALMVGMASDVPPSDTAIGTLKKASGGLPWTHESHVTRLKVGLKETEKVGYCARAWGGDGKHIDPDFGRGYGWKNKRLPLRTVTREIFHLHSLPMLRVRLEAMVTNIMPYSKFPKGAPQPKDYATHGIGRLGADFWPVLEDKRGRKGLLCARFPETIWGSIGIKHCGPFFLRPGRDGAIATAQIEMLRESSQNIEARVFIEKALNDEAKRAKLGEKLATRAQGLLDTRTRIAQLSAPAWGGRDFGGPRRILSLGITETSEQLYALAAEVAKKLGGQ